MTAAENSWKVRVLQAVPGILTFNLSAATSNHFLVFQYELGKQGAFPRSFRLDHKPAKIVKTQCEARIQCAVSGWSSMILNRIRKVSIWPCCWLAPAAVSPNSPPHLNRRRASKHRPLLRSRRPRLILLMLRTRLRMQPLRPATVTAKPPVKPDKAAAYYHFMMAHMYEEMVSTYGRADYATKAIEEYRLAIENDPNSDYLNAGLAELYAKTGRIRDAVLEAQDILKRDGNNLEARRLLGRIYLRSLGDMQAGNAVAGSAEAGHRAVRADREARSQERRRPPAAWPPVSPQQRAAEGGERIQDRRRRCSPSRKKPSPRWLILYNEEGDSARALQVLNAIPEQARTAKLYSALGYTYEQQKDYKQGGRRLSPSRRTGHDNLDSVRGLAQNLMNDGQTDAALEQYKVIADADPSDAQTYMRIAEIDRRNGKFDQAMDALKKATAIVPDSLEVQYNIAVIDEAQGKYDDAIQILNHAAAEDRASDGEYRPPTRTTARCSWSVWARSIARPTSISWRSIPSARCLTLGDDNAIRGYQEIIETYRDNKQWQMATDVGGRSCQEVSQRSRTCRWLLPRSRPTWAIPSRRSSASRRMLKGNSRRPRGLHRSGPDVQPREAVARGGSRTSTRRSSSPPSRKTRITRSSSPAPSTSARRSMTWPKRRSARSWPTIPRTPWR